MSDESVPAASVEPSGLPEPRKRSAAVTTAVSTKRAAAAAIDARRRLKAPKRSLDSSSMIEPPVDHLDDRRLERIRSNMSAASTSGCVAVVSRIVEGTAAQDASN